MFAPDNAKYCIVKWAADNMWEYYFDYNPQLGVDESYTAYSSHTGQQCDIQYMYDSYEEALPDLKKMCEYNPSGYYAICPIIERN